MFYFDHRKSRKHTCQLIELVDEGVVDARAVMNACMDYLSEDQVADLMHSAGWMELVEPDEEEDANEEAVDK